jgi:glycolate oxidase iron-sulfur subunit
MRSYLVKKGVIDRSFKIENFTLHDLGTVFSPPDALKKKGRVVLFAGCSVQFIYPSLGESFIKICNSLGYEVVIPKRGVCCGAPLVSLGLLQEAEKFAHQNIEAFLGLRADAIVSLCPTCVVTTRDHYENLIGRKIEMVDSVKFLSEQINVEDTFSVKAAYHDPCHALYGLKQHEMPRELLRGLGIELVDGESACCGLAGTFSLRFKELSDKLLEDRIRSFEDTGAEIMITSCPGCMLQLSKGIPHGRTYHIVEVVEDWLTERTD